MRVPRNYWRNKENQRNFFDHLGKKLELQCVDDWKTVQWSIICLHGGTRILQYYKSHFELLQTIYPEHSWKIFDFAQISKNFWKDKENHKKFLDHIYELKNFQSLDDWNEISTREFCKWGGYSILRNYSNMIDMLSFHYPNHQWSIYNRKNLPRGFWKSEKNQKKFLDRIKEIYQIQSMADWKKISANDIIKNGGASLFSYYPTMYDALIKLYPEDNWNIFQTKKQISQNFFKNQQNQKMFLEYLIKKENINQTEDLITVPLQTVRRSGGSSLLSIYDNQWSKVLQANFPSISWDLSKLSQTPSHIWDDLHLQREVFMRIGNELGVSCLDDWNRVNYNQITSLGGSSILNKYSSLFHALESIFPEYTWEIAKRKNVSANFWKQRENILEILNVAKQKFKIKEKEDWYRLSFSQFYEIRGGQTLLRKYKSLFGLLSFAFPDEYWDKLRFSKRDKRSGQRWLFLQLEELFPKDEIIEDFYHAELSKEASFPIQLDIFIPSHSIAFEYHGQHHYSDIPAFGHLDMQQDRDKQKIEICKNNNLHLFIVPYWWDRSLDSLRELIQQKLPNISK